jgi:peptidoglycan/xylan/chitin deacetylase (PgdA/CDA1 family)
VRLCAVSVDLDEIPNYFGIHGLAEPEGAVRTLVYDVALDRLTAMASQLSIPLSLFAIGSDLSRESAAFRLKAACEMGFEVANHTLDHRYDLVRLSAAEMRRQVTEGASAIERATGVAPVGFRAPGYTVTDELLEIVSEAGARYDSSVFPCPAYFAAKTAKIAAIALLGRASRSILDTPMVLRAPTRPYRIGRPYWTRGDALLELPIQVTRGLRLPFFGTSITLASPGFARKLARACIGEPLINLELHGIDVLDEHDGLEPLAKHQPDVRVPRARKIESLRAAIGEVASAGYTFVTLREAARAFQGADAL